MGRRAAISAWDVLAKDNDAAARFLGLDEGRLRSLVSRAYYSAYSRITFELLEAGAGPFGGRENPPHRVLPKLVLSRLSRLPMRDRKKLSQAIRRLRTSREIADYKPRYSVDGKFGREALRDLAQVELLLGG